MNKKLQMETIRVYKWEVINSRNCEISTSLFKFCAAAFGWGRTAPPPTASCHSVSMVTHVQRHWALLGNQTSSSILSPCNEDLLPSCSSILIPAIVCRGTLDTLKLREEQQHSASDATETTSSNGSQILHLVSLHFLGWHNVSVKLRCQCLLWRKAIPQWKSVRMRSEGGMAPSDSKVREIARCPVDTQSHYSIIVIIEKSKK